VDCIDIAVFTNHHHRQIKSFSVAGAAGLSWEAAQVWAGGQHWVWTCHRPSHPPNLRHHHRPYHRSEVSGRVAGVAGQSNQGLLVVVVVEQREQLPPYQRLLTVTAGDHMQNSMSIDGTC
jgi:hypothetical protein